MDPKRTHRKPQSAARKKPEAASKDTGAQKRSRKKTNKVPSEEPRMSADVVYLPPKPFSRNRLVLQLSTVAAVVIALVLGLSVFFKVEVIEISGMDRYTAWDVQQASGINNGDNLLTFGRTKAAGKIISALPYVKSVRVGIKLPNTVKIQIEEIEVTYAVEGTDGNWWLISSDGKVVDRANAGQEGKYTKVYGVKLQKMAHGQAAIAWEDPQQTSVTATASDRLKTVVDIAGFLELNGIIGKITSIDVTSLTDIQLWYGDQFQVFLGGTDQLSIKIATMKAALTQVPFDKGILDIRDPGEIHFR